MKAYLAILKRFEIWLLFAVVAALAVYALKPHPAPPSAVVDTPGKTAPAVVAGAGESQGTVAGSTTESSEESAPAPLTIESVRVLPSAGGRIVELALLARSPGDSPLSLDETTLVATTRDGAPVPRFFEPFLTDPIALPGDGAETIVKFWMEGAGDALWLDFSGETAKAELPE